MEIIDTHQHLWDLSRHSYSWCAGIPALNRSFVMKDYLAAAAELPGGAKVAKSVHVEADVDEPNMADETRWILSLAQASENPIAGVVACCRPEHHRAKFRAHVDQFVGNKFLKGVRRILHTQPDDLSRGPVFVENVKSLSDYKLTFDMCFLSRQLPIAIELAKKCPKVSFILDHCGVPDVKGQGLDPWRQHIRDLAALPNIIACKVSGLVAYADPEKWTANDLRPFVEHSIESFGWDRVMFGSDWPVCTLTATYARWVGALLELTASASVEQRDKLFRGNAERVYRLTN